YHEEDLIDFTPELRKEAIAIANQYVRGPMYTATTRVIEGGTKGTWVNPGYGGGSNWNGAAFDPVTGMMFVPTKNQPMIASLTPANSKLTNYDYVRATTVTVQGPRGLPVVKPPWSKITATDMNKGEHRWSKAIGPAPESVRNHPDLKGLGLDFSTMGYTSIRPSPLVTKSLLFMGESGSLSGDPGGEMFRAYDKASGKVVAEIALPAKSTGAPMTYMHKGKQYIVIAVSTRQHAAELVALALPQKGKARKPTSTVTASPAPVAAVNTAVSSGDVNNGRRVFASSCALCHGQRGEGIESAGPPLTNLTDMEKVLRIVTKGGVNMPPMQTMLTGEQIQDVSAFVIERLHQK
ncbi:MAG: c-type cytochrome, partial [Candidatus Obscuribacterales bacterium]|nr:c-type cytochrome [Steroidobacteraceae bacterium]